jgi:hypothetical protein
MRNLELLRMIADAYPGITVLEATKKFSGKPIDVIIRYIRLGWALKAQLNKE